MSAKAWSLVSGDILATDKLEPFVGKKAIIVDDDDFIREALRQILRQKKLNIVSEVSRGERLLDFLRMQKVDYVFLDVKMPGMSGLEVLETMREEGMTPKVVIISGSATKEVVQSALALGAVGFVAKPFNPAAVFKVLDRISDAERTKASQ